MPKSKSKMTKGEMMVRLRKQRKAAGLVEFRVWVTPENHKVLSNVQAELLIRPWHTFLPFSGDGI